MQGKTILKDRNWNADDIDAIIFNLYHSSFFQQIFNVNLIIFARYLEIKVF